MKLLIFAVFCFSALIENKASAYSYSYVPKVSAPVIYNFLYRRREKCETGKKHEYPGKKYGACLSCRGKSVYMIDDIKDKAGCFLCPEGTLIVKKEGYPMCLSNYPVTDGSAQKPNGENVSEEQAALIAKRLSANYKTLLTPPAKEETFSPFPRVRKRRCKSERRKSIRRKIICERRGGRHFARLELRGHPL